MRRSFPQNQFFWHSGNAGKILAGTMYLMEGQFNVWWSNLRRQEVWQVPAKAGIIHRSAQFLRIFRIYRNAMTNPPENQHAISHKKLAFWEHQFWGSSMMTLSSFVTKFRSCRGKLIKIKQNEKHFVKILVKGMKMTLACWIWTIWTMSTTVSMVGHLLHVLSPEIWPPNIELSFYEIHCSCKNLYCIVAVIL